jgi:signal transduction histidine kinase
MLTTGPTRTVPPLTVPPRDVATAAIMVAFSRGGWAIGAYLLALSGWFVIDLSLAGRDLPVFGALSALALIGGGLAALAIWPRPRTAVVFLIVGAIGMWAFQVQLMAGDPELHLEATYMLNRPAVVLVFVGGVSSSIAAGVSWALGGYLVGLGASLVAGLMTSQAPVFANGSAAVLGVYLTLFIALSMIRRSAGRRLPDLDRQRRDAVMLVADRRREERTSALIHDTVLSDLAVIMSSTERIDDATRDRLHADLATLARSATPGFQPESSTATAQLYRDMLGVVNDFQWRGLTIEVSGDTRVVVEITSASREALIGALRACLENVLSHAGTTKVELSFDRIDDSFTVMVVDHGQGFEPRTIGIDRLGIRSSIVRRIEGCGGSVRLWSAPGAGTSVVLSVPLSQHAQTPARIAAPEAAAT